MSRRAGVLIALACSVVGLALAAGPGVAAVSLTDIEGEVMCPTCEMPLERSQSPQANEQRAFIRSLIADGKNKDEIKAELVREYGEAVLADPPRDGFGWAAVVGPLGLIAVLGIGLATVLPRRRRHSKTPGAATDETGEPAAVSDAALSPADTARLDADLAATER